ncbi:MAG: hypothetical protein JSS20_06975, partial [Proteobacteria bacterium]|nr:hypothetical protein [Pseudomonadota bacterium]
MWSGYPPGRRLAATFAAIAMIGLAPEARAGQAAVDAVQTAAYSARYDDGLSKLSALSAADPNDAEALFGIGALQFLNAFAKLQEGLWRHATPGLAQSAGLGGSLGMLVPGVVPGMPGLLPVNPNATPMTYTELRRLLAAFAADLLTAEASLARVGDRPVKIPLDPARLALDLNHDGQLSSAERILSGGRPRLGPPGTVAPDTIIHFDTADASWLRGYANVLLASTNLLLAGNFEATYNVAAHLSYGAEANAFGRELMAEAKNGRKLAEIQADILALDAKLAAFGSMPPNKERLDQIQARLRELNAKPAAPQGAAPPPSPLPALPSPEVDKERRALFDEIRQINQANASWYRDRNALTQERQQLVAESQGQPPGGQIAGIMDWIAIIHTLDWPVIEPDRLKAVRTHLVRVMEINAETWRLVRAETDDDHEWLPNAHQKPLAGLPPVTDEMIDGWLKTTALAKEVLNGEKLL